MQNRIDFVMAPEDRKNILQSIRAAKTAMPFLIKLSKSDRGSLQSIDDGRKSFVEKSIDFAKRDSNLDPGSGLVEGSY